VIRDPRSKSSSDSKPGEAQRLHVVVRGTVQGVGFRPFVYRLATELGLTGWVNNTAEGVYIEVEGPVGRLHQFLVRVSRDKPPLSAIYSLEQTFLDYHGYRSFEIVESKDSGVITVPVLPDISTCPDCIRELFDPNDRRYRYPFINCTNCGPRFSIIERLPYDRPNTTMKAFEMCPDCRREYGDPSNRRFHAQPNACPVCGPRLEWWDREGRATEKGDAALLTTADAIRRGEIVAVKGLGGFHLVVDARNDEAVNRLRSRKHRDEKPFALMIPSAEFARCHCVLTDLEAHLLQSPESPIVLLRRAGSAPVSEAVAPGNPYWGAMLPYTPLHHLLMAELGFPIVATSGNIAEEPICIDEHEALERLGGIADGYVVHNRPIARHVDDSVVRMVAGRVLVMRRARGYAPLPVPLREGGARADATPTLAVGGHLKNTLAIIRGPQAFVSQHIGDMSTLTAFDTFKRIAADFRSLYQFESARIVCDMHPDYITTKYAAELAGSAPVLKVQHHHAHVAACMAENEIDGPVLGVSWDGTGYGADGTVWGGEFLRVDGSGFQRVAHLRTFRLPGGEEAVKEPRRSAAGLLYALFGPDALTWDRFEPVRAFTDREMTVIEVALRKKVNAPLTSSAGRLFDAVASLIGIRHINRYEGQAAMELEFATHDVAATDRYRVKVLRAPDGPAIVDWCGVIHGIMEDIENNVAVGVMSAKFHNTLAEAVVKVAQLVGDEKVVLTGGCFQNRYLTEQTVERLRAAGFRPYWHQRIPPNDGGLALGQLAVAAAMFRKDE
jgi:hydrogenase maturation protein HypF